VTPFISESARLLGAGAGRRTEVIFVVDRRSATSRTSSATSAFAIHALAATFAALVPELSADFTLLDATIVIGVPSIESLGAPREFVRRDEVVVVGVEAIEHRRSHASPLSTESLRSHRESPPYASSIRRELARLAMELTTSAHHRRTVGAGTHVAEGTKARALSRTEATTGAATHRAEFGSVRTRVPPHAAAALRTFTLPPAALATTLWAAFARTPSAGKRLARTATFALATSSAFGPFLSAAETAMRRSIKTTRAFVIGHPQRRRSAMRRHTIPTGLRSTERRLSAGTGSCGRPLAAAALPIGHWTACAFALLILQRLAHRLELGFVDHAIIVGVPAFEPATFRTRAPLAGTIGDGLCAACRQGQCANSHQ